MMVAEVIASGPNTIRAQGQGGLTQHPYWPTMGPHHDGSLSCPGSPHNQQPHLCLHLAFGPHPLLLLDINIPAGGIPTDPPDGPPTTSGSHWPNTPNMSCAARRTILRKPPARRPACPPAPYHKPTSISDALRSLGPQPEARGQSAPPHSPPKSLVSLTLHTSSCEQFSDKNALSCLHGGKPALISPHDR